MPGYLGSMRVVELVRLKCLDRIRLEVEVSVILTLGSPTLCLSISLDDLTF